MGTRNKRTLAEGAIPTIFCYSQPTKKRKTEKREEKNKNSEIVEQLIASTSNDNESDYNKKHIYIYNKKLSNEFSHESSTDTNPVTVPSYASKKDRFVQTNSTKIKLKSVKTQCSEPIPWDDCKKKRTLIKITKRIPIGSHSKSCNTDLSFPPDQDMRISANVNPLFSTPIKAGELDSEKESDDPSFLLESPAGSVSDSASNCNSDTENDFFETDIMKRDDFNDINEPKFIVFWSCLLSVFSSCLTCLSKNFIEKVSVRGTLLYVKTICKNKHVFE